MYEGALERAKKFEEKYGGGYAGYIFPELAESEDERMLKNIISYLEMIKMGCVICTIDTSKEIAWLEKQKEQFKEEKVPEQCLKCNEYEIGYKAGYTHGCTAGYNKAMKEVEQKEQKPAEWSEKYIADIFEKVGLAKIVREQGNDALTNAVQSAMIELSKVENTEWSEEDKKLLDFWLDVIDRNDWRMDEDFCKASREFINRIKSLRPSWKPSKEQMRTLDIVISDYRHACTKGSDKKAEILKSLLEQLQNL